MTNPQRPRLRDVYASARPWPWRVAFPKVSSSREPAGPCLHAASCSSRSPTSVCRREAASLQALLAVQHVSEPCALSLLQPCGGQQPSATSQLAASPSACAAACPARSSSCCYPCHTHGQPLRSAVEAILRSVSLPLRFGRLLLLPACSGRSCLPPTCGCGKSPTALGYSHAVGVGESGMSCGMGARMRP